MYPFKLIIPIGSIFKPNLVYSLPILVNGTRKTRNKLLQLQGKKKKNVVHHLQDFLFSASK